MNATLNTTFQTKKCSRVIAGCAILIALSGCSSMTTRDKNTAIGAGVGAVLTHGSGLGTVGGAAIGGVIGNQIGKKR